MTPREKAEKYAREQCPGQDETNIWYVAARTHFEAGHAEGDKAGYLRGLVRARELLLSSTDDVQWVLDAIEKEQTDDEK